MRLRSPSWTVGKQKKALRLFKQLELIFEGGTRSPSALLKTYAPTAPNLTSSAERPIHLRRRDVDLEAKARELLGRLGAGKLAGEVRVEWNPRMRSAAGRADFRERLISLNPLLLEVGAELVQTEFVAEKLDRLKQSSLTSVLREHERASVDGQSGSDEIDRTLRHELAHLLAQWRVGRRGIAPHGIEWRQACRDLGIADEARCHNLPFATKVLPPRYVYRCPNCRQKFPRVRRIRRAVACLSCCRAHNRGEFDSRFRLRLIRSQQKETKETKSSTNSSLFTLLSSV